MTGPSAAPHCRGPEAPSPFSDAAWERTTGIRHAIDALAFLGQLGEGTLPAETFTHYLAQDALYLADYGRVLAAAAAQATTTEDMAFWAQASANVVEVERALHAAHVGDLTEAVPSPTTTAYTSYLLALTTSGSYPVLAAGILPCFWVYDHVGTRLRATVGELAGHPYGDWIATYGAPEFTAATAAARAITDRLAAGADHATVERMHTAFYRATQYEWMFWDAAHRHEAWPVG